METLTLARFILEMSLIEYDFIDCRDSMMAAAALLVALKVLKVENAWSPILMYHSSYAAKDLVDLAHRLYDNLRTSQFLAKIIQAKYSQK